MIYGLLRLCVLFLYLSHISFIGFLDPFSGLLPDSLLGFPFGCFSFGTGSDLLDVGNFNGDHVYRRLFLVRLDRTLAAIVAFFPTIIAIHLSVAA